MKNILVIPLLLICLFCNAQETYSIFYIQGTDTTLVKNGTDSAFTTALVYKSIIKTGDRPITKLQETSSTLSAKQSLLVSGANIKTINNTSILGSGNINVVGGDGGDMFKSENLYGLENYTTARSNLGLGTLATQNGTFSGTSSGTNTGDNAVNSLYSGLVTNATHTGDATGSTVLTVVKINGVSMAGLSTGILKNTTGTGAPSIAIAGDFPILNQSTTGSAATLTTPRNINGVAFNGSTNITAYTFTLPVQGLTSSPADGATNFIGHLPKAPVTTSGQGGKLFVRQACTIRTAEIYTYSGTAGTNEAWVFSVRVNNTTDTQIASVSLSSSERIFSNTGLSISLSAGDYFEIKMVNPTWATNPLTTIIGGYVMISVP